MNRWLLALGFIAVSTLVSAAPVETVPANEAAATKEVVKMIEATVEAEHKQTGKAHRDAHAKAHGCVKATFTVNSQLPAWARQGVFQEGQQYPAWIRFSNGAQANDTKGDARGMAIKLLRVPGAKLADEKSTQDFLLINHPVFFVRNAADYVEFNKALAGGGLPLKFFFPGINPKHWRLHEANIARQVLGKTTLHPLSTTYSSMVPSLLGTQNAVKYRAKPCSAAQLPLPKKHAGYLRQALSESLAKSGSCFEFMVQRQTDNATMPIEDPTIEWSEAASSYVKVATIQIEQQRFLGDAQKNFCENLSLNPWHSAPEHRPLGGIQRVRKVVYEAISDLRHRLNGESRIEPTGNEVFSN